MDYSLADLMNVFFVGLFVIIALQVIYYTVFSLFSVFYKSPQSTSVQTSVKKHSFGILIPGYAEDSLIVNTSIQALQQSYPNHLFRVIVLADHFKPETITKLQSLSVEVLEVKFENSTKAKSLNEGLKYLAKDPDPVDCVVILDSDNLMCYDFLEKVNVAFNDGFDIVQGHRTAKNQDGPYALLDAINEEIGNSIYRRGHRMLGLSSGLIGSGMAFNYPQLCEIMSNITDVAGEDKMIEMLSFERGLKIQFLEEAVVFDEKVADSQNFTKQRTRWLGAQLHMLKVFGVSRFAKLFSNNFDYLDKVIQMALIPKIFLLAVLVIFSVVAILGWLPSYWLILLPVYCLALLLAVPRQFYNKRLFVAIINIPRVTFFMFKALFKVNKKTATTFEVTKKGEREPTKA